MPSKDKLREEKLKKDLKNIINELKDLSKDREEAGEEREEIGEDVDKIIEEVSDIKKEVDETGDDVDKIIEEVGGIKEEIEETGEDVEEIKEDIEDIKEDIGALRKESSKGTSLFSRVATKVLPSEFAFKDIAQQIVGAAILSAPFSVTEEVWNLANNLDVVHIIALISLTLLFDILLFYYTKYQQIEEKSFFLFPKRIISLLIVTYTTSAIVLTAFGVIGGQIQDPTWALKLIVMVGLFANIGASTADLIR
tara:strand:- start:1847 stop:2602 length:756 start_codon:yes stop_codon:yes gene_type:complete